MLGIVGIASFFVVGLVVSVQLLRLWSRTRQLPELLAALGLLGIGPFGFCVVMLGMTVFGDTAFEALFRRAGLVIQGLGFLATALFTYLSFRRRVRWAQGLVLVFAVGLATTTGLMLESMGEPEGWPLHRHVDIWLRTGCLFWGAMEAIRYARIANRRLRLGIGDPLISASFLCWGLGLGAGALGFAIVYWAMLDHSSGPLLGWGIQFVLSMCGVASSLGLFFAFLPPARYVKFVESRAVRLEVR